MYSPIPPFQPSKTQVPRQTSCNIVLPLHMTHCTLQIAQSIYAFIGRSCSVSEPIWRSISSSSHDSWRETCYGHSNRGRPRKSRSHQSFPPLIHYGQQFSQLIEPFMRPSYDTHRRIQFQIFTTLFRILSSSYNSHLLWAAQVGIQDPY